MTLRKTSCMAFALACLALVGCDDSGVGSDEEAQVAYLGMDRGIDRALKLGFQGFNAASSANIPAQSEPGIVSGTMTVSGQVDQGQSESNKGMRLFVDLDDYSDGLVYQEEEIEIHYFAASTLHLELKMSNLPDNGDLSGPGGNVAFYGSVSMEGDIEGDLFLNLYVEGKVSADANGIIQREPGTTHIWGTAESPNGVYNVDVTR